MSDYVDLESPSKVQLHRSKSYDMRMDADLTGPELDDDRNNNNDAPKKKDSNEPKITVTSFAPNPKAKQTAQTVAVRTSSYLFGSNSRNIPNNSDKTDEEDNTSSRKLNIIWPDGKNRLPLILFNPKVLRKNFWECKKIGEHYRLTYKFSNGEKKLIKALLDGHGFREAHPNSSEFNIIWTGNNLKTYSFRSLQHNQKVNHFPRSSEITRKDRLYKNVQRMGKEKGPRAFNFLPLTFVMPFEIDDFYNSFYKERGLWIVKPASLSRGRGIYLINHPDQIPLEDNLIVSKYISNPLLIEGFKFDLRLYVAVTSFDPLVFYLYEEGLTRFATIKYDQNLKNIKNTCMHLTNYSLNKKNDKYVHCNDPDVEDYGNKWSMGALLRFLFSQGKDTFSLMMNIEEIIIKTLLSVESPLASAARMFVPNRGNCFELFGFDILIDKDLKPWVIEVNLSPSLDCDALLDLKIKSTMVSDLFTLAGVYCQNPSTFNTKSRFQKEQNSHHHRNIRPDPKGSRIRPHSAHSSSSTTNLRTASDGMYDNMSQTEQDILKTVIDESERSNCWIRLFPAADTWEFYSHYLENRSTSYNMMLHKKLYPRRWQSNSSPKKATQSRAKILSTLFTTHRENLDTYSALDTSGASLNDALERYRKYERRLKDNVRLNNETLKRFTHNFNVHMSINNQSQKNVSNTFPNGTIKSSKSKANTSTSTNMNTNTISDSSSDEESVKNATKDDIKERPVKSSPVTRQLPTISNTSSNKQLESIANHTKRILSSKKPNVKPKNPSRAKVRYDSDSKDDLSADSISDDNEDLTSTDFIDQDKLEIKYDLDTILKYLDNGYYISRIQIRNAFALYLFKIHVRLVAESQYKDDSNLQQMDLVLRFIKKAAPNLSQEFKVFVPSKRLPLCEQKRMLAKELHDFLHIYRKDTGQIRLELSSQLEAERKSKKNRNKLIDEKAFQALLYRCCEAELEEIMSVYMKNSHDSSVFLGASKNSDKNSIVDPNCFNLTASISNSECATPNAANSSVVSVKSPSKESSLINLEIQTPNSQVTKPRPKPKSAYSVLSSTHSDTHKEPRLKSSKKLPISPSKSITDATDTTQSNSPEKPKIKKKIKKDLSLDTPDQSKPISQSKKSNSKSKIVSGDEVSELSCESFISNSSEGSTKGETNIFASNSFSRTSSVHSTTNRKKISNRNKSFEKRNGIKLHREYTMYTQQNGIIDMNGDKEKSEKKRKQIVKSAILNNSNRKIDQEVTMTQIYTNSDKKSSSKSKLSNLSSQTLSSTKKSPANVHPSSLQMSLDTTDKGQLNHEQEQATPPPTHSKKLHQQLISISSSNSPISVKDQLNGKLQTNSVFIHRHISNNTNINHFDMNSSKLNSSINNDSFAQKSTHFKEPNVEEYAALSKELKNLNLRQHERVYAAAKSSFRLASSLNSDDHLSVYTDTSRSKVRITDELNSSKNGSLIDHLERQKEKTSRLLQKSKAKHSEMISMSLIKN